MPPPPIVTQNLGSSDQKLVLFLLRLLFALLLPPVSVWLGRGVDFHFILNIILTIFFWVPGLIHAVFLAFFAFMEE